MSRSERWELIVALAAVARAAGWHATCTSQSDRMLVLEVHARELDDDQIPAHVQALADLYDAQQGGK